MKHKCPKCGKSGKRNCPALGAVICSGCCGAKRVSEIDCSTECEYNTFGMRAIETFRKLDNNLFNDVLFPYFRDNDIVTVQEVNKVRAANDNEDDFGRKMHTLFQMRLFYEKQSNGKTVFENWRDNGFKGLSNDCQLLLQFKSKTLPTVIELQKTIDNNFIECIDIFDKQRGKFLLLDPAIVEQKYPRYTKAMTWLEHFPVFSRLSVHSQTLPEMCAVGFIDEIEFQSQNKPYCNAEFPEKQYMLENFEICNELPAEISKQAKQEILSNLDIKTCIAVYDMGKNRKKILKIISSLPDFSENPDVAKPGEQYFDWLRLGKSKAIENDMPEAFRHNDNSEQIGILGDIILKGNSLLLETRSEQKFEFAKQMTEEYFGNMLTLQKEAVQNLAQELKNEDSNSDLDYDYEDDDDLDNEDIPPEVYQELMHKVLDEHYHKFIDESIPLLNGHTPREAAKKPGLRPQLLDLIKGHIHNNETLGRDKGNEPYDLSWLLDELGLEELK